MQFLLNRFNEKYPHQKNITVRFFDEEPLSTRRIRYNQGGAVCYCMENQEQGKQKVSNVWKPVNCTENCQYRVSADGKSKPMCNLEGTLKFLLPEISTDRIWTMKITGYTSIQRLKAYIALQKQLGNSLIGDYVIFLKQEEQTNKLGKTFNNYILDIVKKDELNSNNSIPKNQSNVEQLSTNNTQNVNKDAVNTDNSVDKKQVEQKQEVVETKKDEAKQEETKPVEKKTTTKKATTKEKKQTTTKQQTANATQPNAETKGEFDNYYILLETKTQKILKDGKPTDYLVANVVNTEDKQIDVIIPPQFADELLECDMGTSFILDLQTAGDKTFTNSIKYDQKLLKNVAA